MTDGPVPEAKNVSVEGSGATDGSAKEWNDGEEIGKLAAIEKYDPVEDDVDG